MASQDVGINGRLFKRYLNSKKEIVYKTATSSDGYLKMKIPKDSAGKTPDRGNDSVQNEYLV